MTEKKLRSLLPNYPTNGQVRAVLPAWDGVPVDALNRLRAKFANLRGTPQKQVDWKKPDEWLHERLEGDLLSLSEKTWIESGHEVNPRYVDMPWRVVHRYQLLTAGAHGEMELTDAGRSFIEEPTGPVVQHIDEAEGIFVILLLLQRGDATYGDLLKPWTAFLHQETTARATNVIRNYLARRLKNLLDRDLLVRQGRRYQLTDEGVRYVDESEHGIDDQFIDDLAKANRPDANVDYEDLAEIAAYVEEVLPESSTRLRILEYMATSIEEAHETSPSSWSLSFHPGERFRLNVGRVVALDIGPKPEKLNVSLYDPKLASELTSDKDVFVFSSLEGAICKVYTADELVAGWPEIQDRHLEVVRRAAAAVKRTPYYPYHKSTAVTYLNETVAAELPDPEHGGAMLTEDRVEALVALMRATYPGWDSFRHEDFEVDEIHYKLAAVEKAQTLLAEPRLRELIAAKDFDTFIQSLKEVAHATNLLYTSTPSTGDLSILSEESLDKAAFCHEMLELLYGAGDAADRLGRFTAWVERHKHANRWTFPTYFLFLCHPMDEIFVKPMATLDFLKFLGTKSGFTKKPSASAYVLLRNLAHLLLERLEEYDPRDMIDIQSLIWVCYRALQKNPPPPPVGPDSKEMPQVAVHPVYSSEQFAEESGFKRAEIERWVRAVQRKKQAIFYGPPGTGKTFVAERLARHLVSGGHGACELVQFHPAYAYEDFIQGLRPVEGADGAMPQFRLQPGRFLDFCRRAEATDDTCVLILDEINRANLSRVFGELMYLLEYRDKEVPLAGGGTLRIPENVRIIGTMNTADRSIALVDHALRRRFAFVPLRPDYDVLRSFHEKNGTSALADRLITLLKKLNRRIGDSHYEVGISFFLRKELDQEIEDIWRMEVESYLEEYFADQPDSMEEYRWDKVGEGLQA